jgi:hypothetical protein
MGVTAIAIPGALQVQVETDFIRNFRSDSELVRGYRTVESRLGGAGVWDIVLPAPESIDRGYIQAVLALEEELRDLREPSGYQLTSVLSLLDVDRASQESAWVGSLPFAARLLAMRSIQPWLIDATLTEPKAGDQARSKHRWLRIMIRSSEGAPAQVKSRMIERVEAALQRLETQESWLAAFEGSPPKAYVTGYFVLLARLVDSLIADQWWCFFLAAMGIALALWAILRDGRLVLIGLIPNALPAILLLGGMGWMGWKMNLGVALIAAVSMGLSVDSSLHYLLRFQRELASGRSTREAISACQCEVGMAMFLSTLALVLGFASLCTSPFWPTVVFGATAGITMIGGLVGNLWILPMLLSAGVLLDSVHHAAQDRR